MLVRAFGSDDGQLLDLLFGAIAAVVVGIEVADQRAFHNDLGGIVDLGRHHQREARQVFGFDVADGCASQLAQVSRRELGSLAAADQQQTLGLHAFRLVEKRGLHRFARDFAGGDEVGSGGENSFVVGLDSGIVLVGFVAVVGCLSRVEHGDDEAFGFDLRRWCGSKSSFHRL